MFDGNSLGIGTASPIYKLDTYYNTNGAGVIQIRNPNTGTSAHAGLYMGNNNTTNAAGIIVFGSNYSGASPYNANGTYIYSNQSGGVSIHAEGVAPLALSTNGSFRLYINSGGNVGIGTTSPSALLSVGAGTGNPFSTQFRAVIRGASNRTLYLDSESGGASMWWGNGSTPHFAIDSASGGGAAFWTHAGGTWNSRMTINSDGNVGIGTTSPSALFEVYGNSADGTPTFKVTSTAAGGTFNWAGTILNSSLGSSRNYILLIGQAASTKNSGYIGYNHSGTGGSNSNFLTFGHYGSDNLVNINGLGNVGIGTTSPGQLLHVNGGQLLVNSGTSVAAYRDIMMGGIGGWSTGESHGIDTVYNTASSPTTFTRIESYFDGSSASMYFRNFFNSSAPQTSILMTIRGNGTVGIGTTNPNIYSNGFVNQFTVSSTSGYGNISVAGTSGNGGGIDFGNQTVRQAGVYSLDGSHLGFYTNGTNSSNGLTERIRILSDGNVGIGTTSPAYKLDVTGIGRFEGSSAEVLRLHKTSGGSSQIIMTTTFGNSFGISPFIAGVSNGGFSITDITNNVQRIVIQDSTGNVGIGTTSPSQKLEVVGNTLIGPAGGKMFIGDVGHGTTYPALAHQDYANTTGYVLLVPNNGYVFLNKRDVAGTHIGFRKANADLMVINNDGNVGIGTTSPSVRLQVVGANSAEGQLYVGNTDVTYSAGINFTTSGTNRGFVGWRHTNSGSPFSLTGVHLFNTDNSNIVFGTNNTVKAVINVDGNVGIGTTSPSGPLHVVTGGTSTWAPFVVTATTLWGDGSTPYVTIGAGGVVGIMLSNPHVVWNSGNSASALRMGRSGGVSSGVWYEIGTGANDNFFIAKNGLSAGYQLYINSSGNVGMGTSSPTSLLHVYNNADVWHTRIGGASGELRIGGQTNNGAVIQAYTPGGSVRDLYLQRDGGNVGIGTSGPAGTLHLYNASNPFIRIQAGGGNYSYIQLDDGSSNGYLIKNTSSSTANGVLPGALYTYTDNSKAFQHVHAGSALFTILSGGNVGIGTTSPGSLLHVNGRSYIGTMTAYNHAVEIRGGYYGGPRLQVYGLDSDSNAYMGLGTDMGGGPYELSIYSSNYAGYGIIRFGRFTGGNGTQYSGWTSTGLISTGGTLTMSGDVVAYGSPSDIKFKENVQPLEQGSLQKILKLRGVSFTWKEDTEMSKLTKLKDDIGFIAQEVQEVIPGIVRRDPVEDYLSIRDRGLLAIMVEAIKELKAQNDILQSRIEQLENK